MRTLKIAIGVIVLAAVGAYASTWRTVPVTIDAAVAAAPGDAEHGALAVVDHGVLRLLDQVQAKSVAVKIQGVVGAGDGDKGDDGRVGEHADKDTTG